MLVAVMFVVLLLSSSALAQQSPINRDGARVKIASHLVEDKTNIVFFHAPWSKTSSRYLVELGKKASSLDDVAIIRVDVGTLKSPVAKQYKLTSVPAFLIYDGDGELKMQGQEAQNEVVKLLGR